MSDRVEEAEFWLPSEFLTDEDILIGNKENFTADDFCFPTEFPYYFDSVLNSSDEEDQLAELTRQLSIRRSLNSNTKNNSWVMAGSPQSTLAEVGGWAERSPVSSNGGSPNGPSQVSSPPTSPLCPNNDAWDLIHQAAGQVARLKINGGDAASAKNRALLALQRCPLPPKNPNIASYYAYVLRVREEQMLRQQQQQRYAMLCNKHARNVLAYEAASRQQQMGQAGGIGFRPFVGTEECARPHSACPSLHRLHQPTHQRVPGARGPFMGGVGSGNVVPVKNPCAGTGVFLPRWYGNSNSPSGDDSKPVEYRKKSGCSPTLLPASNDNKVVQNGGVVQPQCRLHVDSGYAGLDSGEEAALLARRNVFLMMQQRRNLRQMQVNICPEMSLPQEWTY